MRHLSCDNSKIRMKKSAVKDGFLLDKNGKDQEAGKWLTGTSIDYISIQT